MKQIIIYEGLNTNEEFIYLLEKIIKELKEGQQSGIKTQWELINIEVE